MTSDTMKLITRWFDGLKNGSLEQLLPMFGESIVIRNAANVPLTGPDAPRRLLEDFFNRTSDRQFTVIDAAEHDGQIFVAWDGILKFRRGVRIGDVVLPRELSAPLRGVDRFRLDRSGMISELDIVHETTSIPVAARELANKYANEGEVQSV